MSSNHVVARARALIAEFYETRLAECTPEECLPILNAHRFIRMERWYLLATTDLADDLYAEIVRQLGNQDFILNGTSYLILMSGFNDSERNNLAASVSSALGWVRKLKSTDPDVAERGFRLEARDLIDTVPWFVFVYLWSTLPVPEVEGVAGSKPAQ